MCSIPLFFPSKTFVLRSFLRFIPFGFLLFALFYHTTTCFSLSLSHTRSYALSISLQTVVSSLMRYCRIKHLLLACLRSPARFAFVCLLDCACACIAIRVCLHCIWVSCPATFFLFQFHPYTKTLKKTYNWDDETNEKEKNQKKSYLQFLYNFHTCKNININTVCMSINCT